MENLAKNTSAICYHFYSHVGFEPFFNEYADQIAIDGDRHLGMTQFVVDLARAFTAERSGRRNVQLETLLRDVENFVLLFFKETNGVGYTNVAHYPRLLNIAYRSNLDQQQSNQNRLDVYARHLG